ncbi:MAG: glycosyltransferase family 39 protein [Candidatus Altiarchaeota archaeon]
MMDKRVRFLVLIGFASRLYALTRTRGMMHFDNLYQLLEPAHRMVFGYGFVPWEYVHGMRSMLQPTLIALVFKLGFNIGFTGVNSIVFINRIIITICSMALLYIIYEASSVVYGRKAGFYSLFFGVFSGLLWVWSADTSSTIPATLFTTLSMLLFYRAWNEGSGNNYFISGISMGVAFMFRFDSMLFIVPLTLFTLAGKKYKNIGFFVRGMVVMLALQGVLDYITWGSFLHSPISFVSQNLYHSKSSLFGTHPPYFYVVVLALHMSCLFLLPYAVERKPGFIFLSMSLVFFFLAYSLVPHKEMRFMVPALPLLFIIAGRGMEKFIEANGRTLAYGLLALTVLQGAYTSSDIGWDDYWGNMQAMEYVGLQADSMGVAYTMPWFESGAYTYLNRKIPAVFISERAMDPGLEMVDCGRPSMDLIGFQCSPLDQVLAEDGINYLIAGDDRVDDVLTANRFALVMEYDGVRVYRKAG